MGPDWKQQWETFLNAPYIIASFMVAAWWIGWWLRGIKSGSKIDGLKGQIGVFENRLTFASEKAVTANEARDDVIRQFQTYKSDVAAANEGTRALVATAARLEAALDKLGAANNAVSSAIVGAARSSSVSSMRMEGVVVRADEELPK